MAHPTLSLSTTDASAAPASLSNAPTEPQPAEHNSIRATHRRTQNLTGRERDEVVHCLPPRWKNGCPHRGAKPDVAALQGLHVKSCDVSANVQNWSGCDLVSIAAYASTPLRYKWVGAAPILHSRAWHAVRNERTREEDVQALVAGANGGRVEGAHIGVNYSYVKPGITGRLDVSKKEVDFFVELIVLTQTELAVPDLAATELTVPAPTELIIPAKERDGEDHVFWRRSRVLRVWRHFSRRTDSHIVFITETLADFDKQPGCVRFIVGDNRITNQAIATRMGLPLVGCANHQLNLTIQHVAERESLLSQFNGLMCQFRTKPKYRDAAQVHIATTSEEKRHPLEFYFQDGEEILADQGYCQTCGGSRSARASRSCLQETREAA
ncbi:hypothetical protein ON010_g4613 [Phytophthora cinnamomi]|nr:hypothetical protein ON010_g4613 [Phytophthora cinnamomi]